jgi:hypothetical protein
MRLFVSTILFLALLTLANARGLSLNPYRRRRLAAGHDDDAPGHDVVRSDEHELLRSLSAHPTVSA